MYIFQLRKEIELVKSYGTGFLPPRKEIQGRAMILSTGEHRVQWARWDMWMGSRFPVTQRHT